MLNYLYFDHDKGKVFFHALKRPKCLWGLPNLQFFLERKAASE